MKVRSEPKAVQKDTFVIGFRAPTMQRDTWHVLGEHDTQATAETALAQSVEEDVRDGAPVGCEWRISQQRGYDHQRREARSPDGRRPG